MESRRIPSTSLVAIATHAARPRASGQPISRRWPFVFSRAGTPDLAADPMPPSASDTYIILKPQDAMAGSGLVQGRS